MRLFADSTALIALGEIQAIDLLRHYSDRVIISPTVQIEVQRASSQINSALSDGWMSVISPGDSEVQDLVEATGLDKGEASLIVIARNHRQTGDQVLIDERSAFHYLLSFEDPALVCLAQVLHLIEEGKPSVSCNMIMNELVASDRYRWARVVRQHYDHWCRETGRESVLLD